MKKVLMISYSFPPKGGGGVLRQFKFAKYLPAFQWIPHILTIKKQVFFNDAGLLKELSRDYKIYRIASLDPRTIIKKTTPTGKHIKKKKGGKESRITSFFKDIVNKVLIPDPYIIWLPIAVFRGLQIIKKEKIDVLYSIDNPCTNHVVALVLKIITRKPWLADFKDPWIKTFSDKNPKLFPFSWLDDNLFKSVINYSDKCVVSDRRLESILKDKVLESQRNKIHIIENGFDKEDFVDSAASEKNNIFTISYTGTLYRDMPFGDIYKALRRLIESNLISVNSIRFVVVGTHEYPETQNDPNYKFLIEKGVLQEKGILSHRESIRCMRDSDLLLFVNANVPNSANIVPSKLYEYLAARKPILALLEEASFCAELIISTKSGYIFLSNQINEISDKILELFLRFKDSGSLTIEQESHLLERFERKNITSKLSKILDLLLNERKA